jgi:hypothetical protein
MRLALVQGPIRAKKTGFPCQAAASTRKWRMVPGQAPVQAARASEAASEVQVGGTGRSRAMSSSAAEKRGLQSGAGYGRPSSSFSGGMTCR